jgi:hypothetical protein
MKILKNFLLENQLASVDQLLSKSCWGFGYTSTDPYKPIWNFDKEQGKFIADIVFSKLKGYELVDYHINGQTPLLNAAVHEDTDHGKCTHTLVFFPHKWMYTWGGRLHIFLESDIAIISPERNLAVLFDASKPHYAEAPTEMALRVSVGLKLRKIEDGQS